MTTIMQLLIHIRGGVSLVMSYVAVGKIFRLGIILAFACLGCIFSSVPAVSQGQLQTQLPNPIKLGVRTFASPLGNNIKTDYAEGFCGTFGNGLKQVLASKSPQIEVQYIDIQNEGLGRDYPRYYGLKNDIIHIECGPNSQKSKNLETAKGIGFSKVFYTTGVKLLLKKDLAQSLNEKDPTKWRESLKKIKIGVVEGTTTLDVLRDNANNFIAYQTREEALRALHENAVKAFASDALIVRTLLDEGVKKPFEPFQPPFKNDDYTIFPKDSYLTLDPTEEYVMAIKKDTIFYKELLTAINKTLNTPEIYQAQKKLKKYESVEVIPGKSYLIEKIKERISLILLGVLIEILGAFIVIVATSRLQNPYQRSSALRLGKIVCVFGGIILILTILGL